MTSSHLPSLFTAILILLCISPLTRSRHVHHRQLHKHHARQLVVPAVTATEQSPTVLETASSTAGDAAIADIETIQDSLSDLPQDLLKVVQTMEHRMEKMEALLQSLISGPSSLRPSSMLQSETFEPTSTATTPIPDFTGLSIPLEKPFETTLSTARATRSSKVLSSPSSFTVTRTTHITKTHTVVPAIVTTSSGYLPANATANGSHPAPVYPYAGASGFLTRPLA